MSIELIREINKLEKRIDELVKPEIVPGGSTGTVVSVTGTAPIASSGGINPDISITQSGAAADGYLSSVDWNTFNNKIGLPAYARGSIAVGGAAAWVALVAKTDKQILIGDGTDLKSVAVTGDVTISNTGVTAIGATKVTKAMMANLTTGSMYIGAVNRPVELNVKTAGAILIGNGTTAISTTTPTFTGVHAHGGNRISGVGAATTAGDAATTSGALTSTRIPYANASGQLADNANFIWDNANQRVGISPGGAPLSKLSVGGVGSATYTIYGAATTGQGVHGDTTTGYGVYGLSSGAGHGVFGASSSGYGTLGFSTTGTGGYFTTTSGYALTTGNGNVGFGTATPGSKLAVVGLTDYANNAAAVTAGLSAGDFYTETGTNPKRVCVVY